MALVVILSLLGCGKPFLGPIEVLLSADTREVHLAMEAVQDTAQVQQLLLERRGRRVQWMLGPQGARWGRVDVQTPSGLARWILLDLATSVGDWEEQRFWLPSAVLEGRPAHVILAWPSLENPSTAGEGLARRSDVMDTVEAHIEPGSLRAVLELGEPAEVSLPHGAWGPLLAGPARGDITDVVQVLSCTAGCDQARWTMRPDEAGLYCRFGVMGGGDVVFEARWDVARGWMPVSPQLEATE